MRTCGIHAGIRCCISRRATPPTMLFFKVGPNPREWWGEVMFSYDGGRSFRDRRRLPEGIDGPVRSKPMLLADGSLLCPSSTEHDHDWRMHFEVLTNVEHPELGSSWQRFEPEEQSFQVIQPTLLRHASGDIQALVAIEAFKDLHGHFKRQRSHMDQACRLLGCPIPIAVLKALTLSDGRHLLLYNHSLAASAKTAGVHGSSLNLVISDDGETWRDVATIEEVDKGELSYPAMIQTTDGKVHMTYTWKRQRVRHVVIDPSSVEAGKVKSE